MTTSESAFIKDIKEIAIHEPTEERRRKAAEARFRKLERELEDKYRTSANADLHVARELADLRRAMVIELDRAPPPTVGSLLDGLVRLIRHP